MYKVRLETLMQGPSVFVFGLLSPCDKHVAMKATGKVRVADSPTVELGPPNICIFPSAGGHNYLEK
jgi:hypothetical protein